MIYPALNGALSGSPALAGPEKVAAALLPQPQGGERHIRVREISRFNYDYADGDNDASPAPMTPIHGTHVAGITGQRRQDHGHSSRHRSSPRVSRSQTRQYPDSALCWPLDDMAVRPDVVSLSLGQTGGMDNRLRWPASVYKVTRTPG